MDDNITSCPSCNTGIIQRELVIVEDVTYEVTGCNKCDHGCWSLYDKED